MAKETPIPLNTIFAEGEYRMLKQEDLSPEKLYILDPLVHVAAYRTVEDLVFRPESGFGMRATARGTAVYCVCVADGMKTRHERYEFIAEYLGDAKKLTNSVA